MLFGVTAGGELYAFNTAGVLQPVFAGGATHINMAVESPTLTSAH